jgi:Na+:H+ antiporter, NhaA family
VHRPDLTSAPETWAPVRRAARKLLRPLERFLHVEAASGVVLLAAAVAAMLWANSPWGWSYDALWHTQVSFGVGSWVVSRSLHFWLNDGLMTVFFFVVGLEIRREMHEGELADLPRATLPIVAAVGGMVAPALLYWSMNRAHDVRVGWGVPTATDIAFAVGVLALLGGRVAPALRVLLLALAIIDDIGAILVIAIFYSSGVALGGLLIAAGGVACVLLLQRLGVRRALAYVAPGVILWIGLLRANVHPTIAGVALGLLTPARPWFGEQGFLAASRLAIEEFQRESSRGGHAQHDLFSPLDRMGEARREALSPVVRLQALLHPWVAYGVMPLFALANAGVAVGGISFEAAGSVTIAVGVAVGLVVGKPLGIVLASWLAVRTGLCRLPGGVSWRGVVVVGLVAGIGFTMAIFIAGLAFRDPARLGVAKLGVLIASATAGILGLGIGRVLLPSQPTAGAAKTLEEAEAEAAR